MAEVSLRDREQVTSPSLPTKPVKPDEPCPVCELCGRFDNLRICAACRDAWYCCKEHQKTDWSKHKTLCRQSKKVNASKPEGKQTKTLGIKSDSDISDKSKVCIANGNHTSSPNAKGASQLDGKVNVLGEKSEASSAASAPTSTGGAINSAESTRGENKSHTDTADTTSSRHSGDESSSTSKSEKANMTGSNGLPYSKEITTSGNVATTATRGMSKSAKRRQRQQRAEENKPPSPPQPVTQTPEPDRDTCSLADYVVKCLSEYGVCVLDRFLGDAKGELILDEVKRLHSEGIFQDGQLVSKTGPKQTIRGDQITWVERGDEGKDQTSFLISRLDCLLMACSERFRRIELGGRTKAMVACYPGTGTYYLRHVDNPNEDGRLITCIYYLNKDWEKKDGGVLRIFPESVKNSWVADIEPKFDRLLFFWSDRRNPHEVQAAYKQRFAITVWYFDKEERQRALSRYQNTDANQGNARTMSTKLVDSRSRLP